MPLRRHGKAVYEGVGSRLATVSPRVVDGGLEMAADKVDVSQQSSEAFAHGNVKASWTGGGVPGKQGTQANNASHGNNGHGATGQNATGQNALAQGGTTLGGNGPAHVIANEAQMNEVTNAGEATFRGHARLWQQANSVTGPVIVLNQQSQIFEAQSNDPAEPVRAVLLNAANKASATSKDASGQAAPSVIRVHGGDLWYSDEEHRALMRSGSLGAVVAETGTATSSSDAVELRLMPAGNHDGKSGAQAQVDRMTASGHVVLSSQGRRGELEKWVGIHQDTR